MGDELYFKWLPLVNNYVLKWAKNDKWLKQYNPYYIEEDCKSFAYVYYREVAAKFKDKDEVEKYYSKTVLFKLNGYIKRVYFNTYYAENCLKEKTTLLTIPVDLNIASELARDAKKAEAVEDTYILDKEDALTIEEKIMLIIEFFKDYYLQEKYRDAFTAIIEVYMGHIKKTNYKEGQVSKQLRIRGYSLTELCKKYDVNYKCCCIYILKAKKKFLRDYPEFKDFLKYGSTEALDNIVEKILLKKSESSVY